MFRFSIRVTVQLAVFAAICTSAMTHASEIVIEPEPAPGPINNPLKGYCVYTDAGEIHQPYSMVFFYVPWSQLEPEPGQYRFAEWEQTWDVPAATGKHIIFRVYVDYPSLPSGLPAWLRKAGVAETKYKDHGGGQSPNYDDPQMLKALERLIAALGARYNTHPRIAFIQAGLLGHWGEWHTWPQEQMYASPATEQRVLTAYRKAFPNKKLMVRYARDFAGQQPWIGFHDDMFPQDTDNGEDWSFLAGLRKSGRMNNWRVSVVGGEMVPLQANRYLGKQFDTTLTMLDRAHFTWVGPYGPALQKPPSAQFTKRSQQLVRTLGYNFQLNRIAHPAAAATGEAIAISLTAENTGVAPFYYPWEVEWALLKQDGQVAAKASTEWDIRSWQPGKISEQAAVQFDAKPGIYDLAIGIRDPWTQQPAISFANDLKEKNGWAIVSKIELK